MVYLGNFLLKAAVEATIVILIMYATRFDL